MRITHLRLTNFAPIYYSLDSTEVSLEYNEGGLKNKTIFIFVGKMGSCKTFLLAHHQPFATLGTLDARNADDMILPGKRGAKEIFYEVGSDIYEILHLFIPVGDHHTLKSYIKKNGKELNENGNSNSFKAIVLTEFGLEQNFLRLFRIGSNVTNLPDMGTAERKSFIGSMLQETEIYAFLYRRLSERARSVNAQMTMLTNRLRGISTKSEAELERECMSYETKMQETQERYQHTLQEKYRIEGEYNAILSNMTLPGLAEFLVSLQNQLKYAQSAYTQTQDKLDTIKDVPSAEELHASFTRIKTQREMREHTIQDMGYTLSENQAKRRKLAEQLAIMGSSEQMAALQESYDAMVKQSREFENQLRNFSYEGTIGSVDTIINDCHIINGLVVAVCQFSPEAIRELFDNPYKAKSLMQREIGKLHKERARINQEMANLKYIGTYVPDHLMLRPYDCPTKDCPFYKYHPVTEQKRQGDKVDSRWLELRNKLAKVDTLINYYDSFPELSSKIEHLKKTWERVLATVQPLGVVREDSLREIVLNPTRREWYNETRLNRIRELCSIREQYYELMQAIKSAKNELLVYEMSDREALEKELAIIEDLITRDSAKIEELERANEADDAELSRLTILYDTVSEQMTLRSNLEQYEEQIQQLTAQVEQTEENLETAKHMAMKIDRLETTLKVQKEEFKAAETEFTALNRKLDDIAYTRTQYDRTKAEQEIMKDIVESLSSKNGIPLAFVKLFLAECKDDINDLISDVFADAIEVQEFYIPEDGSAFNIPYTKNGKLVDDVNKASQGERAVISLALSFALIRQNSFLYNIMLIDEMDGPLYKEDRNKFIMLLMKQIQAIHAEQVFLVSHNNTFDGFNVGIIMTTEEDVEENALTSVIRVGKR